MRSPAIPSIDQLLVLLTVAEAGSFTAAAKRLGRATSAISYAIDTLEEQLGLSLFDRGTTRKPKLTQHGEAVVSEARAVAHSVDTLRARVRGFLDELEPEVSLVVDSMLPSDRLTTLLREFHAPVPDGAGSPLGGDPWRCRAHGPKRPCSHRRGKLSAHGHDGISPHRH